MADLRLHTIEPDELADSYATDPRVDTFVGKDGYAVRTADGKEYQVLHTGLFGWTLCSLESLEFVQLPAGGVSDGHFAIGVNSAGEFIRALIGEPQR